MSIIHTHFCHFAKSINEINLLSRFRSNCHNILTIIKYQWLKDLRSIRAFNRQLSNNNLNLKMADLHKENLLIIFSGKYSKWHPKAQPSQLTHKPNSLNNNN